jgi:hypothetical protein
VTSLDPEGWQSRIVPATADHRGKNLGFEQLQLTRESNAQFLASLYLPWGGQGDVTLTRQGDALLVQVKTDKQTDSWLWAPAADELSPSHVTGKRGTQILITVDENNSNPPKR